MPELEYGQEDLPAISRTEKRELHEAVRAKVKEQGDHFGHFRLIYYFYNLARIDGLNPEEARKVALQ